MISQEDADRFFYQQWMTGDSTDNIWGLWRVGAKTADKILDAYEREEWDELILNKYMSENWDRRPLGKTPSIPREDFALSQARCVRILRDGDYNSDTKEVSLWSPVE